MQDLKLRLLQMDLVWENPEANRNKAEGLLGDLSQVDMVVLPETFSTGFSVTNTSLAESMKGTTVQWLQNLAVKNDTMFVGSLIVNTEGLFRNRLIAAMPNGELHFYDKAHLFAMGGEAKTFRKGEKRLIVSFRGWNLALQICYDLRFPVWNRNRDLEYDAIVFIANWPQKRIEHWKSLLKARAIENLAYTVGLNRTGTDANGILHSGDSLAFDSKGQQLIKASAEELAIDLSFDAEALALTRRQFQFWKDADEFSIKRQNP